MSTVQLIHRLNSINDCRVVCVRRALYIARRVSFGKLLSVSTLHRVNPLHYSRVFEMQHFIHSTVTRTYIVIAGPVNSIQLALNKWADSRGRYRRASVITTIILTWNYEKMLILSKHVLMNITLMRKQRAKFVAVCIVHIISLSSFFLSLLK